MSLLSINIQIRWLKKRPFAYYFGDPFECLQLCDGIPWCCAGVFFDTVL